MKIVTIVFFFFISQYQILFAQQQLEQVVTISFKQDSLPSVFVKLHEKSKLEFAYDPANIPAGNYVTRNFIKTSLENILNEILSDAGLSFKIVGNSVVIVKKPTLDFTISGHIRDAATGEELIGVNLKIPALKVGTMTNEYGFFSVTLSSGNYSLLSSYIGYEPQVKDIHLNHNINLNIDLHAQLNTLSEVVIGASEKDSIVAQGSATKLFLPSTQRLPYFGGEVDLIKALQMQNGIKAMTEGSSGLFVRGGNSDQNLILLDEAVIYNPSHLFGLVSVFNSDAVKNVEVYNDYIPANYGGRLSSVIDTRMAEGNNKEFHLKGGLNLLSLRLAAEGPVVKDRGSFLLTFRRSVIDLLNSKFKFVNPNCTYYDFNVKSNFRINTNNRLFYSMYYGYDHLFSKNSYINDWGNFTSTFRWNHVFSSKLFFNLSAIYSDYKNRLDVNADTLSEKYRWQTGIKDFSLKGDYSLFVSPKSELKFGVSAIAHGFKPGETLNAFPVEFNIPQDKAGDYSAYISHQYQTGKFKFDYGIRAGMFHNAEEKNDQYDVNENLITAFDRRTFIGLEPRLFITHSLNSKSNIHVAYNHNYQYLQLIQNYELAFSSLETWMPASATTKPQQSDYYSAGYNYYPGKYKFAANMYYKNLRNQLELLDHAQVIQNPYVRNELRAGNSQAYGLEVNLSKMSGNFTGDIAYCWSRVFRKIAGINDNNRFPANYDIPHDLKVSGSYMLKPRLSINSVFTYNSGRAVTLPVGYFYHDGIQVPIFEGRNQSRFPAFHRIDFSVQYQTNLVKTAKKQLSSTLSVGVYNAYNRRNPLYYRIEQATPSNNFSLVEAATGIVPWLAYSFKF